MNTNFTVYPKNFAGAGRKKSHIERKKTFKKNIENIIFYPMKVKKPKVEVARNDLSKKFETYKTRIRKFMILKYPLNYQFKKLLLYDLQLQNYY